MPPHPAGRQEVPGRGRVEGLDRSGRGRGRQDDEVTISSRSASTTDSNQPSVTAEPCATLQRHSSLTIPSMIPTQEVLQNLSRYRSKRTLPSVGDNDKVDGDYEDEEEEYFPPGQHFPPSQQMNYENGASMGSSYTDLSPIIPSSTHPPPLPIPEIPRVDGRQRHTPPRRQTPSKKAVPKPKGREIGEIDDSDPIMDFDDSDGEGHSFRTEPDRAMEADPVISSLQPSFPPILSRSANTHRRSPQSPGDDVSHRRPFLGKPESPSRRFVIPTSTTLPFPRSHHHQLLPPDSPTKRLRPLSELPRPVAPPFFGQVQNSPGRRGKGMGSPSRRLSIIPPATAAGSPGKGTAMTPTKKVAAIGKSFKNLRPPPALGPRLQEIADEETRERRHTQDRAEQSEHRRRRQEKGKDPVRNSDRDSLLAGLSSEFECQPSSPLYHGPSPPHDMSSPEPTPPANVYPPSLLPSPLASYASSSSSGSIAAAAEVDLKRKSLLAEVAAMRKRPQSSPLAAAAPSPTLATQTRIKKEEPLMPLLVMDDNTEETQQRLNTTAMDGRMEKTRVTPNTALIDESMTEVQVKVKPELLQSPSLHPQPPPQIRQPEPSLRHQLPQPLRPPQPAHLSYLQPKDHEQQPQQVGEASSKANEIAFPQLILEYASKLVPIDLIKWPPAKDGRFHILALVMSIGPKDQVVTKAGQTLERRQISLCDQSATSFQVELWRERCKWADIVKAGDAVLITDIQMKEYRQKVKGNTTTWSKMSRLDGSVLGSYQGNTTVETHLRVFIIKRRILALDLLDKDRGIARDPSFYLTQSLSSLPDQSTTGAGVLEQKIGYESPARLLQRTGRVNVTSGGEGLMPLLSAAASAAFPRHAANTVTTATGEKPLLQMLPPSVTGVSIRASVVYRMLIVPGDDSQGWEVGAVMSNGRLVKVRTQSTVTWISDASPGRLLHFFGRFQDKSDIFHIDASSREPYSLSDNTWGNSMKRIEPLKLSSIRSLHEHKFMGDATIDGYILAVSFPDFVSGNIDKNKSSSGRDDMFGFIKCYCTGCRSPAVSSPQNPAVLFCTFCHLDPQKNNAPLEWFYPAFELSLGDKPQMGACLLSENMQLRCQFEMGDQVFWSVPARRWMQDEEGFWKSRRRWERLVGLMNTELQQDGECERTGGSDARIDVSQDCGDGDWKEGEAEWKHSRIPQRVRVEVRVGVNMVAKALRVNYL